MERANKDNKGITRRDALKRMGLLVAGAAALGMPTALTSCHMEKKKRIILYFTATGNSLYIARQLADENTELLSIPQMVKQGRHDFEADEIGIVYPIYGHMPPNMVRSFICQARLKADYKFAVLTYGARKCDAVEIWDGISRKAGNPFDYIATIIMVDSSFLSAQAISFRKNSPALLMRISTWHPASAAAAAILDAASGTERSWTRVSTLKEERPEPSPPSARSTSPLTSASVSASRPADMSTSMRLYPFSARIPA